VYNNIGLEPKHTTWNYALVIWNLGKWNSVKWNETHRIGAIFASFWVAWVCQRQLGFLVDSKRLSCFTYILLITNVVDVTSRSTYSWVSCNGSRKLVIVVADCNIKSIITI